VPRLWQRVRLAADRVELETREWPASRGVIDGDTVEISSALGKSKTVRIIGITPEIWQANEYFGEKASNFTKVRLLAAAGSSSRTHLH
jgi:endonuclease YncB( thermonuclease family)